MSHLLGIFKIWMHRGSNMSAHVLLNLLNELRKRLAEHFISFLQRVKYIQ